MPVSLARAAGGPRAPPRLSCRRSPGSRRLSSRGRVPSSGGTAPPRVPSGVRHCLEGGLPMRQPRLPPLAAPRAVGAAGQVCCRGPTSGAAPSDRAGLRAAPRPSSAVCCLRPWAPPGCRRVQPLAVARHLPRRLGGLPWEAVSPSVHRRRLYTAPPMCGWRAVRGRARSPRLSPPASPVRVPRPAPSFHAACKRPLARTPVRFPCPAAPRTPGRGTCTPEHDRMHGTHARGERRAKRASVLAVSSTAWSGSGAGRDPALASGFLSSDFALPGGVVSTCLRDRRILTTNAEQDTHQMQDRHSQ
jgi:hypothetical protein